MKRDKDWERFEDYIIAKLQEVDQYCKTTPGSGNQGIKGDIKNNVMLHIECKQRNTKSVTINSEVWKKLCKEIPLHANKIPILTLENKEKKRWAILDLDDFLNLFIELTKYREGDI